MVSVTFLCHISYFAQVNDIHIVKSGSDFKEFSEITIEFSDDKQSYTIRRHEITSDLAEDEEVAAIVSKYLGTFVRTYMYRFIDIISV